jgi:hypothetical protein
MKQVAITDFLTEAQLERCVQLGNATDICREVIQPSMVEIDKKLGQKNDAKYLAYMVEFVLRETGHIQ